MRVFVAFLSFAAALEPAGMAAEFVVQVSVDGLNASHLQTQIDAGLAPNFKRFQEEGAWTNNARTDYTHTITLPNHISMLTGRPVCAIEESVCNPSGPEFTLHHGYTANGAPLSTWTLHNQGNQNLAYKAGVFDVVHDAGLSTALFASKSKFVIFDQSYNSTSGAFHANGRDKIDEFFRSDSETVQSRLIADLAASDFAYTFVHYADPDTAGHRLGWGSPEYLGAIATVDAYLGELFNLVKNDPQLSGRTAIVLTTDHGGISTAHGDVSNAANYTIPFYVWGAGVAHGDLYSFNVGNRADPGSSQPSYRAAGQPIRNGDSGNFALGLLELNSVPGSSINAMQDLRSRSIGDFNLDNVVDGADYVVWRKGIDVLEPYADWRTHFAEAPRDSEGNSDVVTVPEPTSLALIAFCGFAISLCRPIRNIKKAGAILVYSSSMAGSVFRPALSRCCCSSSGVRRENSTGMDHILNSPFVAAMRMFFSQSTS
jgi:hypothetical protein